MKHRGLEQLEARQFNLLEVVSSSLTPATKNTFTTKNDGQVKTKNRQESLSVNSGR